MDLFFSIIFSGMDLLGMIGGMITVYRILYTRTVKITVNGDQRPQPNPSLNWEKDLAAVLLREIREKNGGRFIPGLDIQVQKRRISVTYPKKD